MATPDYQREWRRRNPALERAQTARYRDRLRADPEKLARRAEYMRQWHAKNPTKYSEYARKRYLRSEYGLTPAQYQAMVEQQDGKCAICLRAPRGRLPLHVDHSHSDGKIRGLLCSHCNAALGQMRDDVGVLKAAIQYLEQHACRRT